MKVGADGVYKAIVDLTRYRGFPPTVREICDHVGVNSTSTVHDALMRLVRDGRIVHDPTKPRTIKLTGGQPDLEQLRRALLAALDRCGVCSSTDTCRGCVAAEKLLGAGQ